MSENETFRGRHVEAWCMDCPKDVPWGKGITFSSVEEAREALDKHKKETGHRG